MFIGLVKAVDHVLDECQVRSHHGRRIHSPANELQGIPNVEVQGLALYLPISQKTQGEPMECRESRLSGYPMIQCMGGNATLNWLALRSTVAVHSGSELKSTTEDAGAEGVLLRSCERSSMTLSSLVFSSSLDRLRVSQRCQWAPSKPR